MNSKGKYLLLGLGITLAFSGIPFVGSEFAAIADNIPVYRCADITFGKGITSNNQANDPSFTVTNILEPTLVVDGGIYQNDAGNALRFSSGSKGGTLTINFAETLRITQIRFLASVYGSDSGVSLSYSLGTAFSGSVPLDSYEVPDFEAYSGPGHYTVEIPGEGVDCDTLVIKSQSKKRFYLHKIVFTLNDESRIPDGGDSTSSSSSSSSSSSTSSSTTSTGGEDLPYYDSIDWSLTGAALKTDLYYLIKDHDDVGYGGLLDSYARTDVDENGYIVDMYSNCEYRVGDSGGNYKKEGDCYNREHIIPQSVFYEHAPMRSDLFNVYPTDGYVNNRRGSFPHGSVGDSVSYTSSNGSKVGKSNAPGYSGTVFEPIDQYKGDIARSYFYMVTCYEDQLTSWKHYDSFDGKKYPGLSSWALDLYMEWNELDPVDSWERQRNEAVYLEQGNRNPFIDHPEAVAAIWG